MVEMGRERGWPLDTLPLGPTGRVPDPDYDLMCEGRIEEAEFLARCLGRLRAAGIDFDPRTDIDWDANQRPATWDLIRDIYGAGRHQVILTNDATRWMGSNWWETWEPAKYFVGIVDVSTLSARKPAPEPYLAAATAGGVAPSRCIFVDDMPVNCRGAEAVGMASHFFDIVRPEASIASLRERIGL
jgi:putative hydrolase of the HAD superfamily